MLILIIQDLSKILKAAELDKKKKKKKEEKEENQEEENQFSLLTLFLQRALLPFTQQTQLKNHMTIQMQKMGFLLLYVKGS